jgi:hypothetical protein
LCRRRHKHDLRHTHATLAVRAGVHPKVVSERLGHATVSITLDTYSHAIPALQEDGPRALEQSVKPALQRALRARVGRGGGRRLGSLHLLLGILSAKGGTVVRALAATDIDRAGLAAKVRTALEEAA